MGYKEPQISQPGETIPLKPIVPTLDRNQVGDLLRRAFLHVTTYDYGFKYTDNEEDVRAALYYRIRQLLDCDPRWRVFLSFPLAGGGRYDKPDLCFLRSKSLSFERGTVTIELLVEVKNWPSTKEIADDFQKLAKYSQLCANRGQPDLYFAAILGTGISQTFHSTQELLESIKSKVGGFPLPDNNILLRYHNELYRGPWPDPWRFVARGK